MLERFGGETIPSEQDVHEEMARDAEADTRIKDIIPGGGGIDRFHAHLDECQQCRDHPFDLCPTGARLLKAAAEKPF